MPKRILSDLEKAEKDERRRKNEEGRRKAQERRLHRSEMEEFQRQAEINSLKMRYTGSEDEIVIPQGDYILVVSENSEMVDLILYWLLKFGYKSEYAVDVDQVLLRFFRGMPVVVICDDVFPPLWSGGILNIIDILGFSREFSARILLRDWVENPIEFRHSFDLVLVKPFVPQELISYVDRLLTYDKSGAYQKAQEYRREHGVGITDGKPSS